MRGAIRALLILSSAFPLACAGFRPANVPLERFDPQYGYRPNVAEQHREVGQVYLGLAFSGGGTRAAALAYGVLEELRDTEIVVAGERRRLIDEVDAISGVSGGSFPAAYYGLFGDRVFDEFEERFLRRNVQRELVVQALRPRNWLRLLTPYLNRSELASQLYDRTIFDGTTFADLAAAKGPRIHINATDLSLGSRFTFTQGQFDVICSDLQALAISRAVAASSAVPVLLSPLTLQNFAGTCQYEPPDWLGQVLEARETNPRGYRAARNAYSYLDANSRKFIHLVDGGISDNLGLRFGLDVVAAAGSIEKVRQLYGLDPFDHFVLIVVNAETDPDPAIDLSSAAPGFAALMNAVSGAQIRRYNFETILLTREALSGWASGISGRGDRVESYMPEVSFDAVADPEQRHYLKRLPTSFTLKDEDVDKLRAAGRQLLRQSPDFRRLLENIGAK